MVKKRDEFPEPIKKLLAERAGYQCSNPGCKIFTVGPGIKSPEDVIRISVAAHITAAAEGGPRYDPSLTQKERKSIKNGIHLCANCSRMIDANNGNDHSIETLRLWKNEHEIARHEHISKPLKNRKNIQIFNQTAIRVISCVQKFEDVFLFERDRSFEGNFEEVVQRQQIMGNLLDQAMLELRSELAVFSEHMQESQNIRWSAMTIIRLYRLTNQKTETGSYFWGMEHVNQATLDTAPARVAFQEACKMLRESMRQLLT